MNFFRRRIEGWRDLARRLRSNPRDAGNMARDAAIRLWSSRGGGFYGLGYVVTFLVLEVRVFVTGIETSDDVVVFLGQELLQAFFRLAYQSLVNSLMAFIWPLFVLDALRNWGIALLVAGWWAYGRWAAPVVGRWGVRRRERVVR